MLPAVFLLRCRAIWGNVITDTTQIGNRQMTRTTKEEAAKLAKGNLNAFHVAEFRHMMGKGKRPNPVFYGISGTTEKPGNSIEICGHRFLIDDLSPPTAPVFAA